MLITVVALLALMGVYIFFHEFIHGIFIKKYSGEKAKYGFTGLYAYAGSNAYFCKRQYLIIALAPVVLFGGVFLMLNVFLPPQWFWFVYLLQMINISSAAGDLYVTYITCRVPADVLIRDKGLEMIFYSRKILS